MKNHRQPVSTSSYLFAFLIGVLLFWSFGRNWLHLESLLVFLAGLIGVAVPVLLFGIWNILRHSHDNEK